MNGKLVGLFANATWSVRQDKVPNFILGRYNPAEITPTAQEAVSISLTGYRVVDAGPYKVANATLLKDLLNENDFAVAILDRQTGELIFQATGARVTGWSSGAASRGVSDIRIDILALIGEDESTIASGGDSDTGASNLTDGA